MNLIPRSHTGEGATIISKSSEFAKNRQELWSCDKMFFIALQCSTMFFFCEGSFTTKKEVGENKERYQANLLRTRWYYDSLAIALQQSYDIDKHATYSGELSW